MAKYITSRRPKKLRGMKAFDYVNYIFLALCVLIMIYPFVFVLAGSFSDGNDYMGGGVWLVPRVWTLANYQVIVSDNMLWIAYKNTIIRTAAGSLLSLSFTSLVAYAMSRRELKFRRFFQAANLFTMFFGGGLIPYFVLINFLGLFDTFWVYIIPALYSVYNMIILSGGYSALSEELHDSAVIDGAGELRIWISIYMPLSKAVHATVLLWLMVGNWNAYYSTMIYTRGGENVILLQYYLMGVINKASYTPSVGGEILEKVTSKTVSYAAIIVAILPVLFVYPFLSKYFTKGVTVGSLKG
ncbi:MAG: carbohydrate ABC transporter permease [Clostridia bacterium]|nr:carbohydrate ABC transporter permease [Clostridia bacterium]